VIITTLMWALTVGTVVFIVLEAADAYRNRPLVMWDDERRRWRAKRGYQGRKVPR
jgi:hypothetical protein